MPINTFLFFFFSTFMISATPGPNMLLAFQHGLNYGVKRTLWTLAGLSAGLYLLLLSALLGLDVLTKQFPWALLLVKVVGSGYLAYLGVQSWRHAKENKALLSDSASKTEKNNVARPWQLFKTGMWVSLSNPKAILFFAAFFPKFIDFGQPLMGQYVMLILGFFISETLWQMVYTFGGKNLANWLQEGQRLAWMNRSCGALFVLIAVGLMLEVLLEVNM